MGIHELEYLMHHFYWRNQKDLAADLCVSRQTLNSWLNGRSKPSKKHLGRIEDLYMEKTNGRTVWGI